MTADLQNLTEDELLAQLDRLVYGSDEYISGRELQVAIERSRKWVSVWVDRNRRNICRELRNRGLTDSAKQEKFLDFATVVEIIGHTELDSHISPVLAAILLKRGIHLLCP